MSKYEEIDDKLCEALDENESYVRNIGFDETNIRSIITEDRDKVYEKFSQEIRFGFIKVYNFDEAICCENCQRIMPIEDSSVDTETGEVICGECLKDC